MKTAITCLLYLIIVKIIQTQEWYEKNNPIFLHPDTVDGAIKQSNAIKIVKYFSPWCGYCRRVKQFFDDYKQKNKLDQGFKLYDVNCDQNIIHCRVSRIYSFPCLVAYDNSGKQLQRMVGLYPNNVFQSFVSTYNNMGKQLRQKFQQQKKSLINEYNNQNQSNKNQQSLKKVQSQPQIKETIKQNKIQQSKQVPIQQQKINQLNIKQDINQNQNQFTQTIKQQNFQININKEQDNGNKFSSWIKIFGYLCCFVIGGFYFKKIMVPQEQEIIQSQQSKVSQSLPNISQSIQNNQTNQQKEEIQNLVKDVPDQDL